MAKTHPYLDKDIFFEQCRPFGLAYDDVSLATQYSEVLPRETQLETTLAGNLVLQVPVVSSDMDTVTESRMAIAMALRGGLGLIHYNMSEKEQIRQVARVKNHIHGLIQDPIKVSPEGTIGDVIEKIKTKGYNFRTFPVVGENGELLGLLSSRVVKERYQAKTISEAMVPREALLTINQKDIGKDPIAVADQFFNDHMGIHKLLVVDDEDRLCGLFTLSDVERINEEARSAVKPSRDSSFRLVCGAALSIWRKASGELDHDRICNHASSLIQEGVDALALSVAHGYSKAIRDVVSLLRRDFPGLTIIAGNVTCPEAVEFLAKAGANVIKVGQGPGSICTTRIVAGVGVPQLTALYETTRVAKKNGVSILADGGVTKSGDLVKALTLADAVVCGGLLAGCKEAPGKIIEINGKFYKEYRGMGSHEAMKAGSAARYGHDAKDTFRKISAEGIEALKEVSESVDNVLLQLIGGLQSGMGYLGAANLKELKEKARYVRVTFAGQKESAPHNVIELKTAQKHI